MRYLLLAAAVVAAIAFGVAADESEARGPAYYGTDRGVSARTYSGLYNRSRPVVPTFTLPTYGGGYGYRGFRRRGPDVVYYPYPVYVPYGYWQGF